MGKLIYLFVTIFTVSACQAEKQSSVQDDSVPIRDTIEIGSERYVLELVGVSQEDIVDDEIHENFWILYENRDIVYQHKNLITGGIEVVDLFDDGVPDILLGQFTNVGGVTELVQYDTLRSKFVHVEDWEKYSYLENIPGTLYFYSYHRSGCADSNWGSELLFYEDYGFKEIAYIEGRGCEGEVRNGIFIYKGDRNTGGELIVSFEKEAGFYHDKWDFIEEYWKNYVGA